MTMTRPKIVDPPALTEVKKMLRDYVKKVPAAQRAKVRAATERVIEDVGFIKYAGNVDAVPDRVFMQTLIPFFEAYRAMTEGEYGYLFRELGDLSTRPLKQEVDTAANVVEAIEYAMQSFQDHIRRKWKEHQRRKAV
ncbi:MAG: hypothetical protein ACLP3Q_05300 [Streptosporangiaceae bacterium]